MYWVVERGPQMLSGVGPPWSPTLASRGQHPSIPGQASQPVELPGVDRGPRGARHPDRRGRASRSLPRSRANSRQRQ
ncbi:transcriptional regulator, AraC family [Mycobacterium xenopi 4042]|uniref:Transcriptional regulator, AraC family n=1 Tax=Mycobacterium xenopi 4042 TaxID=1299334 RepID=X8E469_MYCXE|nr:transcriptional regulator, AraC family [Mycobacterium xenopi 4042]